MRAFMEWPGIWASAWFKEVLCMNAVLITAIICTTIIILAIIGKRK